MNTQVQKIRNKKQRVINDKALTNAVVSNNNVKQAARKKSTTKKIIMNNELAEKRQANLRTPFNSLPMELKFRILLGLDCDDLIRMKKVCSQWYEIIKQLLEVKAVDIPLERRHGPSGFMSSIHDQISFEVYQTKFRVRNLIDRGFIANTRKERLDCNLDPLSADRLFTILEEHSRDIHGRLEFGICAEWEDVMWNYILRLTGENRSIEKLKKEGTEGKFADYITSKYGWWWWTDEDYWTGEVGYCGIIVLHFDRKTFSILKFPVLDVDDSEDDSEDFYGCAGYYGFIDSSDYYEDDF